MSGETSTLTLPAVDLSGQACLVCGTQMRVVVTDWTARCPQCGSWTSSLKPEINEETLFGADIDDAARVSGLQELRRENFNHVLDRVSTLTPLDGARLLDVGSAHGWFMEEAAARGAHATGVEPDDEVAADPLSRGLDVRSGYFPDALEESEKFDIVTFNDVLEHIPDVRSTLEACSRVVSPGGVLSVNIPNADGLGYRIATRAARLGVRGPYERFWQYGLPSPHCHYFTRAGLGTLIADSGFVIEEVSALSAVSRQGLWDRVHTFRRTSVASTLSFAALWSAAPILNRPRFSDIVLVLARRVSN